MKKRALFIGGTGTISSAITARVAADPEWELYLLNRGNRSSSVPQGVSLIQADINDEAAVLAGLGELSFDCVCDFIGLVPEHVERDWRLFDGRTRQYIFISSASAYQKPCEDYIIDENVPLSNPYWQYSRDKIACEELLMGKYRECGFPVTIVRPSHTYDERKVPLAVCGTKGTWQVLRRMLDGKPVIIPGDGKSLWTVTHNSDFAKGFTGLMGRPEALGRAFQITSDESLTWDQIYATVASVLGVELIPYHVASDFLASVSWPTLAGSLLGDKSYSVVFDNARLKSLVPDFKATVSFREGIGKTIGHILSHPECQIEDLEFDQWCDRVIAALETARKSV